MSLHYLPFKLFDILLFAFLLLISGTLTAQAHNNPEFKNELLKSVNIEPLSSSGSEEFTVALPKDLIRVVWSIDSADKDNIVFSVKSGDKIIAEDIKNGAETLPNILTDNKFMIVNVKGTETTFKLDVLARLIVKKEKKSADTDAFLAGRKVYRKANCVGCHKWHGSGGGGYGGAALSLRTTGLDKEGLKYLIRCGRPSTGMPYHGRKAYKGDDTSCYNTTAEKLGKNIPPRARSLLSERQLNVVVDYVENVVQGSGEITLEQCVVYWGEKSRQCDEFRNN